VDGLQSGVLAGPEHRLDTGWARSDDEYACCFEDESPRSVRLGCPAIVSSSSVGRHSIGDDISDKMGDRRNFNNRRRCEDAKEIGLKSESNTECVGPFMRHLYSVCGQRTSTKCKEVRLTYLCSRLVLSDVGRA
jgi:hypothetical protein